MKIRWLSVVVCLCMAVLTGSTTVMASENNQIMPGELFLWKMASGWTELPTKDGTITVYYANGHLTHGQANIDGEWYYFDGETGAMATGLVEIPKKYEPQGAKTCYFGDDGKRMSGWIDFDDGRRYFNHETGAMAVGKTVIPGEDTDSGNDEVFYFNDDGIQAFGELLVDDEWIYIDPETGHPLDWIRYPEDAQDQDARMANNAIMVWMYFKSRGWTMEAVAGMLGNMQMESMINPTSTDGIAYGLVQWTPISKLEQWCIDENYMLEDGRGQCARIQYEMENEIQWFTADYNMTFREYSQNAGDPQELAHVFMANYERPYYFSYWERATFAQYWYDYLKTIFPNG